MKTGLVAVLVCLVLFLPRLAEACPACSSKGPGGPGVVVALGLMILLPFAILFFVVRALRRATREPSEEMNQ